MRKISNICFLILPSIFQLGIVLYYIYNPSTETLVIMIICGAINTLSIIFNILSIKNYNKAEEVKHDRRHANQS